MEGYYKAISQGFCKRFYQGNTRLIGVGVVSVVLSYIASHCSEIVSFRASEPGFRNNGPGQFRIRAYSQSRSHATVSLRPRPARTGLKLPTSAPQN